MNRELFRFNEDICRRSRGFRSLPLIPFSLAWKIVRVDSLRECLRFCSWTRIFGETVSRPVFALHYSVRAMSLAARQHVAARYSFSASLLHEKQRSTRRNAFS
jgi:hypothetical protein